MLRIYNTLSGKKEPFRKTAKPIKMFVCGPTVYGEPHIGNGRTFMNHDLIVRYLRSRGYKVFYLQNITDVDDKIIQRAAAEGMHWKDISRRYERIYLQNLKALNITSVDKHARATDHIKEIVRQVRTLIGKGHAYLIPGDGWYFDLATCPEYGKLSRRTAEQAEDAVTRIDTSDRKRNRGDFCLWKLASSGAGAKSEPAWKTELGEGRPGWHIEDTAISEYYFGPQYDIHGGGVDLKFPHHEAEIAQQESASGLKPFVRIWMHSGFLLVNGRKMSKSLGNFLTLNELLDKHHPETFRMMVLGAHYRSSLDYTEAMANSARKNLSDLRAFLARLAFVEKKGIGKGKAPLAAYERKFHAAMDDDFNTPEALAAIFELVSTANKSMWVLSRSEVKRLRLWLSGILKTMGFRDAALRIPPNINKIAARRELSRRNKQFMQADALRKEAEGLGYIIEDTPLGPLVLPR